MLYIDGIIFALQSSGGISMCFKELLNEVKHSQIDYRFLSYGGNQFFDCARLPNDKIIQGKTALPLFIERYIDVNTSKMASIFHSSYYRLPIQRNLKTITTVHDFTYERYGSGVKKFVHHSQKRRAVLNSDTIICISESTKRDLYHFIPESMSMDVRVILNGVSPDYHILQEIMPTRDFVLYVGARSGYKNFSTLVKALSFVPTLRLVSVGGGPLSDAETMLLQKNLPDRYTHMNFVSNEDLNILYNNAFCFAYPSLYEGFGIPVLEAMRAGCPVIASNSSSLPEVCGDAAILLDDVNPDSLAHAINCLNDTALRACLVDKGLKKSSQFSWEKNVANIMNLYKETEGILG